MAPRVFIIHGYQGHPDNGWKPWVAKQLREKGHDVQVPVMPHPDKPQRTEWVQKIRETVGKPQETDILIGHSLGCAAVLRYLESLEEGSRIGKFISVAGFFEDPSEDYEDLRNFIDVPFDLEKIRSHCISFTVIHSDDDGSIPTRCAQDLANALRVPLELYQGYGHFSSGDGITELPLILEKI